MNLLEYLDRVGERRLEHARINPPRPRDTRQIVAVLFFAAYYGLVLRILSAREVPADVLSLVKDAMLVLGPVVGMIAQAIFRSDVKDEIATQNTGEFARATTRQAEATIAAAATTPTETAGAAADRVADAAGAEAARVNREIEP